MYLYILDWFRSKQYLSTKYNAPLLAPLYNGYQTAVSFQLNKIHYCNQFSLVQGNRN